MISERLDCLAQLLRSVADAGTPLSAEHVLLVAHAIENMLPHIEAMESQPVPARFRVIVGGRGAA